MVKKKSNPLIKTPTLASALAALALAVNISSSAALAADAKQALRENLEVVEPERAVPQLAASAAYEPKDNTLAIEISEYAGYAGIVVANNGLEPSEDSIFFKKFGFKVRLTLSEEDSWDTLQKGRLAANVTTADVLPLYGQRLQAETPLLIGYSRGADALLVRSEIKTVNDLKGKTVAISQFNESDFLIRYLAQQAGLEVALMDSPDDKPAPDKINLVACADAFGAGDFFRRDVADGRARIHGCMTWEPKTGEVLEKTAGKTRLLVSNRNLLVVADILLVNKGFAAAHPDMVQGLVEGILEGNALVRAAPSLAPAHRALIAKAFEWDEDDVASELSKVHLANHPENLAFFDGSIDSAGSFSYIYESAVDAYGSAFIPRPVPAERFIAKAPLDALKAAGRFANETASIKPIKTAQSGQIEEPLLARDIRFLFEPNSGNLDLTNAQNTADLEYLTKIMQVSPGSTLLLRGHVDNSMVEEFRKQGGASLVQTMSVKAVQLSKDRSNSVRDQLVKKHKIAADRIEVLGCGWREPTDATDHAKNRRVEAQWFTVE